MEEGVDDLFGGVLYEAESDDREEAVEEDASELSVVVELESSSTVTLLRSLVLLAVGGVVG